MAAVTTREIKSPHVKDKIVLGRKYRETILGRTGVANAVCMYLTGCDQVELIWLDEKGKRECCWVDCTVLEAVALPARRRSGGPTESVPPTR